MQSNKCATILRRRGNQLQVGGSDESLPKLPGYLDQLPVLLRSTTHHVALKDIVHDLMPWQSRSVHEQLEGELEPRVHLPATRLPLAFFPPTLISIHGDDLDG